MNVDSVASLSGMAVAIASLLAIFVRAGSLLRQLDQMAKDADAHKRESHDAFRTLDLRSTACDQRAAEDRIRIMNLEKDVAKLDERKADQREMQSMIDRFDKLDKKIDKILHYFLKNKTIEDEE